MAAAGNTDAKQKKTKRIEFTHQPCPDGFSCGIHLEDEYGAENIELRPWTHGSPPDLSGLAGADVGISDAMATVAQLKADFKQCNSLRLKDHHDNDLTQGVEAHLKANPNPSIQYEFDRTGVCCGSLMLYRMFHPNKPVPLWQVAINKGDTDLLYTRTDDEEAYHAFLTRAEAMVNINTFRKAIGVDVKEATAKGHEILIPYRAEAKVAVSEMEFREVKGDRTYMAGYVKASCPQVLVYISKEAFAQHLKKIDLLCLRWTQSNGTKQISLRSFPHQDKTKRINVAKIAACFGGNGHPMASGVQKKDYLE
jgi:hypothetical protein